MKKLILSSLLLFLLINNDIFSENKINQENQIQQTRETFKKLIENAHPSPDPDYFFEEKLMVPLQSNSLFFPLFLNVNTIVNEVNESYKMQNESSIAINPTNPNNLIASAVDYRDGSSTWIYVSDNGGQTWNNINLGKPFAGWQSTNDPSVAFANDGTGYLVYGGFGKIDNTQTQLVGENGVFIARSTDQGKSWKAHIPVILHQGNQTLDSNFEDKYYIQVDNSTRSPYNSHLYIPWKRVTPRDSATQIVISQSTDFGNTWSIPIPVSPRKSGSSEDTTYGQSFPLATTGPNGEVYVVWNDGIVHGVGFAKSLDGGKTFSSPKIIQYYKIFGTTKYIESQGGYRHTVKGKVRAEAYPVIQCDITGGSRDGYLYLTWAADSIPNIYFSRSTDKGETWSEPKIIHSDTANDQFWQWLSVDPKNGDIAVMYFDSRDDPDNILVNCYVSYSTDGGETWIDKRVGDDVNDLRLNPFMDNAFAGDYSGLTFYNGKIYPSWVDMRNAVKDIRNSDVYTAIINTRAPMPVENLKALIFPNETNKIQLNWTNPTTFSFGQKLNSQDYKIRITRDSDIIATLDGGTTTFLDKDLESYRKYNYSVYTISNLDSSITRNISATPGGSLNPASPIILSANGYEDKEDFGFDIISTMPSLRADNETPLVDLDSVAFYLDGNLFTKIKVLPTDTGKPVAFRLILSKENYEKGYYRIQASIVTARSKYSELSNMIVAFSGNPIHINDQNNFVDNFDGKPAKKYYYGNKWGFTTENPYSAPNCLSDSPYSNYQNNTKDTFLLFPVYLDEVSQLNFYHIALFEPNDLATIEFSSDNGLSWSNQFQNKTAIFKKTDYSYWNDSELDSRDWVEEHLLFPSEVKNALIRFRISTNVFKNDLGWFIDNISITPKPINVKEENFDISVYPNPTSDFVKIVNFLKCTNLQYDLYSSQGVKLLTNYIENEAILDLRSFSPSYYFLIIHNDYGLNQRYKIILLK